VTLLFSGAGLWRSGGRAQLARHPALTAGDQRGDHGHRAGHLHPGLRGRAAVLERPPAEPGRAAGRRAAAAAAALGVALAAPLRLPRRRRFVSPLERARQRNHHSRHKSHHGQYDFVDENLIYLFVFCSLSARVLFLAEKRDKLVELDRVLMNITLQKCILVPLNKQGTSKMPIVLK